MYGDTRPGRWLKRHGWKLEFTEPHGYATTHYWRSPDGELCTQTYALIEQRSRNRWVSSLRAQLNAAQQRIAELEAERDGLAASLRKARAQLEYIRAFIGWVPSDAERVRREHDAVIESLADPSAILAAHDRRAREQVIDEVLEQFNERHHDAITLVRKVLREVKEGR